LTFIYFSITMRTSLVMLGFALAAMSSTLPVEDAGLYNFLSKRAVSPDNTCGNVYAGANKSYSCDATLNSGGCCSQYGTCASLGTNFLFSLFRYAFIINKRCFISRIPPFLDNADSRIKDTVEIQQAIAVQIVNLHLGLAAQVLLQVELAVRTMEGRFAQTINAVVVGVFFCAHNFWCQSSRFRGNANSQHQCLAFAEPLKIIVQILGVAC
jgi:hypothetical protein